MEDFMCNVLIMGKTGTGKSSLLNYLCENDMAKTGTGKPVTEEGIYDYVVSLKGQEVRIFDSWGIEAGKVDRWKALIADALKKHGVQKSIADWFHSVIYCVQAGGGRVEDIDTEIIRQFLDEGYKVTIVLTKADQVDEDDEANMRRVIIDEVACGRDKNSLNVIATCAQQKKTRSGVTEPFGREEVCNAILDGWRDTVTERLPKHIVARICEVVENRSAVIKQKYMSQVQGLSEYNEGIYANVEQEMRDATSDLDSVIIPQILKEATAMCHKADMQLSVLFDAPEISMTPSPMIDDRPYIPSETKSKRSGNGWTTALVAGAGTLLFGPLVGVAGALFSFFNGRRRRRMEEEEYEQRAAMQKEAANHNHENILLQQEELRNSIDGQVDSICQAYKDREVELGNKLKEALK